MHTIGGVIKDLFRMLMGRHFKRGRMSDALVDYMVQRNKVPVATQKRWEAGKYLQNAARASTLHVLQAFVKYVLLFRTCS